MEELWLHQLLHARPIYTLIKIYQTENMRNMKRKRQLEMRNL